MHISLSPFTPVAPRHAEPRIPAGESSDAQQNPQSTAAEWTSERNAEDQESKPGLRVYRKSSEVPRVLGGLGVAVLSTNRGLMTDREARRRRIGGEVLAYVW